MENLFSSVLGTTVTVKTYVLLIVFSLICGAIAAFATSFKEKKLSKSYFLSIILLPAIVCMVILMVNGSVGTGIAVAGAFSLVRFRSAPGKAKEITGIFLSMTAGIACATGYIGIAVLFTIVISVLIIAFSFIPFASDKEMNLRITVPESLNYEGVFDEILSKYTSKYELGSVRTSDLGSLYKLSYKISLKPNASTKALIDEIRCRNGNLEIRISAAEDKPEEL